MIKGKDKTSLRITVDKGLYSHYLLSNIRIVDTLRSLNQTNSLLEISYENDILPGLDYCKKLYEFLELDYMEPAWVNSKKVAPSPREFITNYDRMKLLEKKISESQRPLFSLRYFIYSFMKVVYDKTINLINRST